jgi:hypothetical protein
MGYGRLLGTSSTNPEIGPVHQTDAVQHADGYNQTSIDAINYLSLLFGTELALISGAILRTIDVFVKRYPSLLRIQVFVGAHERSHCAIDLEKNTRGRKQDKNLTRYRRYMSELLPYAPHHYTMPSTAGLLKGKNVGKYRGNGKLGGFVR